MSALSPCAAEKKPAFALHEPRLLGVNGDERIDEDDHGGAGVDGDAHVGRPREASVAVVPALDLLWGVERSERDRRAHGERDGHVGEAFAPEDDVLGGVLVGGPDIERTAQLAERVGHTRLGELPREVCAQTLARENAARNEPRHCRRGRVLGAKDVPGRRPAPTHESL